MSHASGQGEKEKPGAIMHTKINQNIKKIEDKLFSPGFKHKSFCWKYFAHVTWIYLSDTSTIAFSF